MDPAQEIAELKAKIQILEAKMEKVEAEMIQQALQQQQLATKMVYKCSGTLKNFHTVGGKRAAVVSAAQRNSAYGTIEPSPTQDPQCPGRDLTVELYFEDFGRGNQFCAAVENAAFLHTKLEAKLDVSRDPEPLRAGLKFVADYTKLDDDVPAVSPSSSSSSSPTSPSVVGKDLPDISAPCCLRFAKIVHWVPKAYDPVAFSGKRSGELLPWFAIRAPHEFNSCTNGFDNGMPSVTVEAELTAESDPAFATVSLVVTSFDPNDHQSWKFNLNHDGETGERQLRLRPFTLSSADATNLKEVLEFRAKQTERAAELEYFHGTRNRTPWYQLCRQDTPQCVLDRVKNQAMKRERKKEDDEESEGEVE